MDFVSRRIPFLFSVLSGLALIGARTLQAEIDVTPNSVRLDNPEASQQLLVTDLQREGRRFDITRRVEYYADDPNVAAVNVNGMVSPNREGQTRLHMRLGTQTRTIDVRVSGINNPPRVTFADDVLPILTKAGCNSGRCHGKAEGQHGFKLSVFGFDAEADYDALLKEGRGRRVFSVSSDNSLLLLKATAAIPHGGGRKLEPGSAHEKRLRRWISEGAVFSDHAATEASAFGFFDKPVHTSRSPKATGSTAHHLKESEMKIRCSKGTIIVFLVGATAGSALVRQTVEFGAHHNSAQAQDSSPKREIDLAALRADVERLKNVVPDQSHAMLDVDYHFTNLWFAGKALNWPLAEFYWKETLSHVRWAVRIIPVRKDNAGHEVKLENILQAIENTPHLKMGDVIQARDAKKFEVTYRMLLEQACYTCHKASDKPYLRPQIPERPAAGMINFDPKATWPK